MPQLPLFNSLVFCGFPCAEGHSMKNAGIFNGDLLMVKSYKTAGDGDIVIAELDGEFTCKYLKTHPVKALVPANEDYKPVFITDETDIRIFGIVRYVIYQTGR